MATIDVCLSPSLLPLYHLEGKLVIVVDILRATSCMVTAIAHGVDHIIPFDNLEQCNAMKAQGYLTAAERDGKQIEGFDFGNSPFTFQDTGLAGKQIAVTTTNGTACIKKSEGAKEIGIGAFLNLRAVAAYIRTTKSDVVIACSAWKGKPNAEDTLFAGALIELLPELDHESDNCLVALTLWKAAKESPTTFINETTHVKRLHKLGITDDIEFCMQQDVYPIMLLIKEGQIQKA
jgi:2-phosphosulfolactate phosphatase